MADVTPTRGAALALSEEASFLETGFGFLDEKRMLLAATLMEELTAWKALRDTYAVAMENAVTAQKAALLRHGLEGLQQYTTQEIVRTPIELQTRKLLGLVLNEVPEIAWPAPPMVPTPEQSPEAETCRAAFAALVPLAAQLAARQANIHRLIREYRATERRAKALENVLLPETRAQLRAITDYLDEADQEEAIRIRNAAR